MVRPIRILASRSAFRVLIVLSVTVAVTAPATTAEGTVRSNALAGSIRIASPNPAVAATSNPVADPILKPQPTVTRPDSRALTPAPSTNALAGPVTRLALTQRLGQLRSTYGMPGVSAAILFADGTLWRATSGFADVRANRRLTADTQFAVASISKTFLAALILVLAQEGKVGLDAPVSAYLPDLAIGPSITVRQLLDHTSGLHDYFYDPDIDEALMANRKRVWTAEDALSYVGKPYFEPGQGWAYSNTNYVILGLLAESIGGAPLAEQLRARFIAPLGLDHTHYQWAEAPVGPLASAYRFNGAGVRLKPIPLGDGTNVVPFTSVVTAAGSAGSVASTATDLVAWASALYGGRVLAPESLDAMISDVVTTAPFRPSTPYGLGVQAATIDGRRTLGHSGRLLGSRTVVRWLPEERISIAVLTNQSRSDPNLIVRALLRDVLGMPRLP